MIQPHPSQGETYEISVQRDSHDQGLTITIDGEVHSADIFEFSSPKGAGLAVRKVTRVELVGEYVEER